MAQDFNLPDLGENITGGDVVRVMVAEGDTIQPNQTVIEIETDKAVLEVPCPFGGKVAKVHVKQGQKAKVGAPLISVESNGAVTAAPAQQKKEPPAAPAAPNKPEPQAPAPSAAKSRPAAEASAEAKSAKSTAPAARKPPAARSASSDEAAESDEPRSAPAPAAPPAAKTAAEEDVPAGPATRRLARELGVSLSAVAAKYPNERLTEEHVKGFVRDRSAPATAQGGHAPAVEQPELPDFSQWGDVERVPFSSLQRKTAEHLSIGWRLAPHVTQFDAADVTSLEALRKRYRERGPAKDVKLTVTAFILKAITAALKEFPQFNATLDMEKEELILKQYYHIGVAVDTEAGLIVPVIKDVDRKRVLDLAAELEDVADRTRRRKIKPDELKGGAFTVTNLGGIGGTGFTPIINYPEVAILGLARSKQELFLNGDELATRTMLPLCLSYDHRVVNGADGARFTRKIAEMLEDPEMLLLQ